MQSPQVSSRTGPRKKQRARTLPANTPQNLPKATLFDDNSTVGVASTVASPNSAFDEVLQGVLPQSFAQHRTSPEAMAVVPVCAHPACGEPIVDFPMAIWCSLEEYDPKTYETKRFALRSFHRQHDVFGEARRAYDNINSGWWELTQLWQRDQRGVIEKGLDAAPNARCKVAGRRSA